MKTTVVSLLAVVLSSRGFAATHAVLPGESIQAKVDIAAPGDIIAISGGTYAGDVIVDKAIRLVEMDGHEVTITGNVTFTGVTNAPPFEGFTVGSPGKGITVANTSGIVLKNIDASAGLGVAINGLSKAAITGGFYSKIMQDGGELTTTLTQVVGNFETTVNAIKTVALRTNVGTDVRWNSRKSWMGYSNAQKFDFNGTDCKIVIVGCSFDLKGRATDGLLLSGQSNKFEIMNSVVKGVTHGHTGSFSQKNHNWFDMTVHPGFGIRVSNATNACSIINCYVSMNLLYYGLDADVGYGIISNSVNTNIFNTIIQNSRIGIYAPYQAKVLNNFFSATIYSLVTGGAISDGTITGDPLFVVGQAPALQPSSTCINAGVADPLYYDLDGTRNDIGPGGGCLFDPAGWTTNKPVVISFDLAPQQLLRGVDTQVTLSKGLAVGQP